MFVVENTSISDLNLRLVGSWTLISIETMAFVALVREVYGRDIGNSSGYVDAEVKYLYCSTPDGDKKAMATAVELAAPTLGYMHVQDLGVVYVQRPPERQNRAALPERSCTFRTLRGRPTRLDSAGSLVASAIATKAFLGEGYEVFTGNNCVLSSEAAVVDGVLYGPGFNAVGTITATDGGAVRVRTKHPILAQSLLSGLVHTGGASEHAK